MSTKYLKYKTRYLQIKNESNNILNNELNGGNFTDLFSKLLVYFYGSSFSIQEYIPDIISRINLFYDILMDPSVIEHVKKINELTNLNFLFEILLFLWRDDKILEYFNDFDVVFKDIFNPTKTYSDIISNIIDDNNFIDENINNNFDYFNLIFKIVKIKLDSNKRNEEKIDDINNSIKDILTDNSIITQIKKINLKITDPEALFISEILPLVNDNDTISNDNIYKIYKKSKEEMTILNTMSNLFSTISTNEYNMIQIARTILQTINETKNIAERIANSHNSKKTQIINRSREIATNLFNYNSESDQEQNQIMRNAINIADNFFNDISNNYDTSKNALLDRAKLFVSTSLTSYIQNSKYNTLKTEQINNAEKKLSEIITICKETHIQEYDVSVIQNLIDYLKLENLTDYLDLNKNIEETKKNLINNYEENKQKILTLFLTSSIVLKNDTDYRSIFTKFEDFDKIIIQYEDYKNNQINEIINEINPENQIMYAKNIQSFIISFFKSCENIKNEIINAKQVALLIQEELQTKFIAKQEQIKTNRNAYINIYNIVLLIRKLYNTNIISINSFFQNLKNIYVFDTNYSEIDKKVIFIKNIIVYFLQSINKSDCFNFFLKLFKMVLQICKEIKETVQLSGGQWFTKIKTVLNLQQQPQRLENKNIATETINLEEEFYNYTPETTLPDSKSSNNSISYQKLFDIIKRQLLVFFTEINNENKVNEDMIYDIYIRIIPTLDFSRNLDDLSNLFLYIYYVIKNNYRMEEMFYTGQIIKYIIYIEKIIDIDNLLKYRYTEEQINNFFNDNSIMTTLENLLKNILNNLDEEIKFNLLTLSTKIIAFIINFIVKDKYRKITADIKRYLDKLNIYSSISNNINTIIQSMYRFRNKINLNIPFSFVTITNNNNFNFNTNIIKNITENFTKIFNSEVNLEGGSNSNTNNTEFIINMNNNLCDYLKYLFLVFIIFKEDNFNQIKILLTNIQNCFNITNGSNIYNNLNTINSNFYKYIKNLCISTLNQDNQKYIDKIINILHNFITNLLNKINDKKINDLIILLNYLRNIFAYNLENINNMNIQYLKDSYCNIKYKTIGNLTFYNNTSNFCTYIMDDLIYETDSKNIIPSLHISYTEDTYQKNSIFSNNSLFDITQIISLQDILLLFKNICINFIPIQILIYNFLQKISICSFNLSYDINITYTELIEFCNNSNLNNIDEIIYMYITQRQLEINKLSELVENEDNDYKKIKQIELINEEIYSNYNEYKDTLIRIQNQDNNDIDLPELQIIDYENIKKANTLLLDIILSNTNKNAKYEWKKCPTSHCILFKQIIQSFDILWYKILDNAITNYIDQIISNNMSLNIYSLINNEIVSFITNKKE